VTIPFIRTATSAAQVVDLLARCEIPPMNQQIAPFASLRQAADIGAAFGLAEQVAAVLSRIAPLEMDPEQYRIMQLWADRGGFDLALRPHVAQRKDSGRWPWSVRKVRRRWGGGNHERE
jgi:hypothetical protein